MKKRQFTSLALSFLLLLSFVVPVQASAPSPVRLWMSGQYLKPDVDPIIRNDRTLVPLRIISENLGYDVEWEQETLTVVLRKPNRNTIALRIGEPYIQDGNWQMYELDVAPILYKDRTMVPIRVIAENLGLMVDWDNANRTVVIGEGYSSPVSSNTFQEAYVTRTIDGDTIEVSIQGKKYKVRMIGVDTPETKHPQKGVEYFGKEASAYTASQLTGKTVYLQQDVSGTDRYGRLLAYIWLSRPSSNEPTANEVYKLMYNSRLVENGFAHASPYPPDIKYQELLKTRETIARNNNYGLWGNGGVDPNAVTPTPTSGGGNGWQETKNPASGKSQGKIIGNRNSMIYHVPGGASYDKVSAKNAVYFDTEAQAQAAGYRRAKR